MIYKNKIFIYKLIVILICFLTTSFFTGSIECKAETNKVIILYDENREYGKEKSLLNDLVKSQLATGNEVTIKKINLDNLKNLEQYDEICVLYIKDFDDDAKNLKDKLKSYGKPIHWFGKDFNDLNAQYYLNNTNKENLQSKGEIYFCLDNVTPFNDLNNLIEEISYLKDNGIKFFIDVFPVFVNEDLKAMGRFTECLRYAQANGGEVVLKFPILNTKEVNGKSISGQLISEKIKVAFNNYTNYWVYPVGMSINESLLYREDLKNLLECTDTLFFYAKDNINIDVDNYTIKSYENIIQKINIDDYIENRKINVYEKRALCVESDCNFDDFKKNVDKILKEEVVFNENNKLNSYMKFDDEVKSTSKGIFFNNKDVTQQRFISEQEYKNAFAKEESKEENPAKKDLTMSNKMIKILSIVALLIFLVIIVLSKNIERKKFFR